MEEIWKDVAGYEGLYMVSNLGQVKSCDRLVNSRWGDSKKPVKAKIKALQLGFGGYKSVTLFNASSRIGKRFYVHRLVATAFLSNEFLKPQVNHINGDKLDNRAVNLEWCTGTENQLHALSAGLYETAKGEQIGASVLTEQDIYKIRYLYSNGMMQKDIAEMFPVKRQCITKIVNRKRWKHI